jgi:hypothetical protein
MTTLKWTLEQLAATRADAVRLAQDADEPVRAELEAAQAILGLGIIDDVTPVQPTSSDLAGLTRGGAPWNVVAPVGAEYLRFASSLTALASELLRPSDDEFGWRLFHLGVFGQVLVALKALGAKLVSRAPLSGGTAGPAYEVLLPNTETWHLWFEAAGVWSFYGTKSPYVEAAAGTIGSVRALGADVLLIHPHHRALLLECKYSSSATTVGRDGYHQASSYALEVRSRLAHEVLAYAVGPTGVVTSNTVTEAFVGFSNIIVGVMPPEAIASVLHAFAGA